MPQLVETDYSFLGDNKKLTHLYLPKLEKKYYEFLIFMHPNRDNLIAKIHTKFNENINSKKIAELDKDSKLTTTELSFERKNIENMLHQNNDLQK